MYALEYRDDEGNNYKIEYDWTWFEALATIKDLKRDGFTDIELTYIGE